MNRHLIGQFFHSDAALERQTETKTLFSSRLYLLSNAKLVEIGGDYVNFFNQSAFNSPRYLKGYLYYSFNLI